MTSSGTGTRTHRFAIVVDRMPTHLQRCAIGPDVGVEMHGSLVRLLYERRTDKLTEAVVSAIREVESLGLRAMRVDDQDWVTIGEIAARIGKSRETVRLWSQGQAGPGGFPLPLNHGHYTAFYSWAEVAPWLRARTGMNPPGPEPALVAIGLALRLRAIASRVRPFNLIAGLLEAPANGGSPRGGGNSH